MRHVMAKTPDDMVAPLSCWTGGPAKEGAGRAEYGPLGSEQR